MGTRRCSSNLRPPGHLWPPVEALPKVRKNRKLAASLSGIAGQALHIVGDLQAADSGNPPRD